MLSVDSAETVEGIEEVEMVDKGEAIEVV